MNVSYYFIVNVACQRRALLTAENNYFCFLTFHISIFFLTQDIELQVNPFVAFMF